MILISVVAVSSEPSRAKNSPINGVLSLERTDGAAPARSSDQLGPLVSG